MVRNFASALPDFSEAAAAISALDAVVTIDSAMAHVAGALGRPCFLMLPYYPNFRWMTDSDSFREGAPCPWYPSVRVFRQSTPGDWSSVVIGVARELASLASCAEVAPRIGRAGGG